jgi:hypothetical protein
MIESSDEGLFFSSNPNAQMSVQSYFIVFPSVPARHSGLLGTTFV